MLFQSRWAFPLPPIKGLFQQLRHEEGRPNLSFASAMLDMPGRQAGGGSASSRDKPSRSSLSRNHVSLMRLESASIRARSQKISMPFPHGSWSRTAGSPPRVPSPRCAGTVDDGPPRSDSLRADVRRPCFELFCRYLEGTWWEAIFGFLCFRRPFLFGVKPLSWEAMRQIPRMASPQRRKISPRAVGRAPGS